MKKIKIVDIISCMIYGGVESVVYNYYSNMDLSNFDLYIITRKNSKKDAAKKFEDLGFKFLYVDDWEKNPFSSFKEILKIMKEYNFDIIHSHLSHTNFYFMILGKIANIPVRISHSHLSEEDKGLFRKIKHFIYKLLIKMFSTNLVACGKEAAVNLYGKKRQDIVIFNNAIQLDKYSFDENMRNKYRKEFNININDLCLSTVGRMTYQKNQLFLIEIFNELKKINSSSKLLIVGDGELKNELICKINEYSLVDDVILLKDRNDVNNLLFMSDIFCLPSLYEGLPVVGIEAQATNLPCVFSDTIDSDVDISNKCYFMSLNDSSKKWAEKINDIFIDDRSYLNDNPKFEKFDIKLQSKKMEDFYINEYKRRS